MPSQRVQRVQSLLRSEISTVLQRKLKDPRVSMATVSHLEVSADLRHARVFMSIYADQAAQMTSLEGLRSAAGFIRAELMKVLHLRPMPYLDFRLDDSLARGSRTLDLLEQIRHAEDNPDQGVGPGTDADQEQ